METKKQMPHLGNFIRNLTYKQGYTGASLGNAIGKSPNTVTGYSNQPSLHARILWDISQALNFDVFEYLSNALNLNNTVEKNTAAPNIKTKQQKIEELELLVRDLQIENTIYKNLLEKKLSY
jgi:transcriptional regulator with XRE-family HTH domain